MSQGVQRQLPATYSQHAAEAMVQVSTQEREHACRLDTYESMRGDCRGFVLLQHMCLLSLAVTGAVRQVVRQGHLLLSGGQAQAEVAEQVQQRDLELHHGESVPCRQGHRARRSAAVYVCC